MPLTPDEQKELKELRAYKDVVEPVLHRIYDELYFDTDAGHFDPDLEWESACGISEFVAGELIRLMGKPVLGSVEHPDVKVKA